MDQVKEGVVSTVIPVFNRSDLLVQAVESVLNQTYRSFEVIISDDGSTDDTPRIGRELVAAHPDSICYIRNPNRGAGPAREEGRQKAIGEFIQYLDSDDLLWPKKFEIQVEALRKMPDCGAAYGYIRLCPEDGPPIEKPYKWSGKTLSALFPWLLVDRWWNTDCPLFRREICDAVGPWSDLPYSQDWEYDARVGALRTKLAHTPEFVCDQRQHSRNRQTGHGRWLGPEDRVRFFSLLLGHAEKAGVPVASKERKHFARWVFSHARQCGEIGHEHAARALYILALRANGWPSFDMLAFDLMARTIGWQKAAKIAKKMLVLTGKPPGRFTRKQSWMEKADEMS